MQFADLLLLLVDGLHLLLGLLGELFEFFLHACDLVGSLTVFIVLEGLLLGLPDLFE